MTSRLVVYCRGRMAMGLDAVGGGGGKKKRCRNRLSVEADSHRGTGAKSGGLFVGP